MRETDFVGGFAKGLKIIEAFGETVQRLTIAEAAKLTGLDRATARRCLLTLADLGYADYDGKFFSLTPRILRLGHAYLSTTPLPLLVQPYLDQLAEKVGQSASVSVLDGTDILYVARASHKRIISINLTTGSRLPAYCVSMGRVLLAALPDPEILSILSRSTLKQNTAHTKTDIDMLMSELHVVASRGFAVIDQELELGLCSIAVPVLNSKGKTIAALNIGAPAAQVAADDMQHHYLAALQETQKALMAVLR
jgi:IclR family pca regulon transcriptional regulator